MKTEAEIIQKVKDLLDYMIKEFSLLAKDIEKLYPKTYSKERPWYKTKDGP